MRVIIDSNIFWNDFHFDKTSSRTLLESKDLIPLEIYIPEVVIDETVNHFRERIIESYAKYTVACKDMKSIVKREIFSATDIDEEVEKYKLFIEELINKHNIQILPYPNINHKAIVSRDLLRKKPFKRDGTGYRDTLIWESIKRICEISEEATVFLTNNTVDFGLGPNIDATLSGEFRINKKIELCKSINEFVDKYITPRLESYSSAQSKLKEIDSDGFDFKAWIKSNLLNLLYEQDLNELIAGFPEGVGSTSISSISEYHNISIEQAKKVSEQIFQLEVNIEFKAICTISSDWDEYCYHKEVRTFWGNNEKFNWITTNTLEDIKVKIRLMVNSISFKVENEELIYLEMANGSITMN